MHKSVLQTSRNQHGREFQETHAVVEVLKGFGPEKSRQLDISLKSGAYNGSTEYRVAMNDCSISEHAGPAESRFGIFAVNARQIETDVETCI